MILRFSEKGSPYVELDEHNRFIFSRLTANDRGIKYLLYSNTPLDRDNATVKARDNWFTTMYFKNPKNGKSNGPSVTNLGVPHSFKSNVYWKNGTVSILRKMIAKHLLPTGEFPEKAFPSLAEDIVKYNHLAEKDKEKLVNYVREEERKEEEENPDKRKRGRKPKVEKKPKKKVEKVKKEKKINKPEKKVKKTKKVEKKKTKKVKVKAKPKKVKKTKKVVKKKVKKVKVKAKPKKKAKAKKTTRKGVKARKAKIKKRRR